MSSTMISIRVPDDDLAVIDRRAQAQGMNRTAFMLGLVLDRVTADERRFEGLEERMKELARRLNRVEERQKLGFS